jgi:hypothetical protein
MAGGDGKLIGVSIFPKFFKGGLTRRHKKTTAR